MRHSLGFEHLTSRVLTSFISLCTFVDVGILKYFSTCLFLFFCLESAVLHFNSWATLLSCADTCVGLLHLSSFLSCLFILFASFFSTLCHILAPRNQIKVTTYFGSVGVALLNQG